MKEYKQNIVDGIKEASVIYKVISLKDIAEANGINHIARQDTQDIIQAVRKALPEYRAVRMMNTPNDSLFQSVCFVENGVEFDDGEEVDG